MAQRFVENHIVLSLLIADDELSRLSLVFLDAHLFLNNRHDDSLFLHSNVLLKNL